ncbi:MAG: hypothetical protein R2861_13050 [Desulfobacterales bacterium]
MKISHADQSVFLSLIHSPDDPLGRQVIPDVAELDADDCLSPDPLNEEPQSPTPHLIHRYLDRVVFKDFQ